MSWWERSRRARGCSPGCRDSAAAACAAAARRWRLVLRRSRRIWGFDQANGVAARRAARRRAARTDFEKGTVGFEQGVGGGGGGGGQWVQGSLVRAARDAPISGGAARRRRRRQQPAERAIVRAAPWHGRTDRAQLHAARYHRAAEAEGGGEAGGAASLPEAAEAHRQDAHRLWEEPLPGATTHDTACMALITQQPFLPLAGAAR